MKKMQNNKITTPFLTLSASSPRFCDFKSGVFVNFPLSRKDHRFNLSLGKKTAPIFNKRLHLCYTFCSKYF